MKPNKLIIAISVLTLAILGLGVWLLTKPTAGSQLGTTVPAGGKAEVPVTEFDWGTIDYGGGDAVAEFTISNPGPGTLSLAEVGTSCMCTTAYLQGAEGELGPFGMPGHGGLAGNRVNETIKPGETRDLKVVFDPNAHGPAGVGAINRSITLTGKGGKLQFTIEAVVTP